MNKAEQAAHSSDASVLRNILKAYEAEARRAVRMIAQYKKALEIRVALDRKPSGPAVVTYHQVNPPRAKTRRTRNSKRR